VNNEFEFRLSGITDLTIRRGFAQTVDLNGNDPVNTGSAGALARYEREARNSYSVKKFELERAAHAVRARAPALPALACLFLPQRFFRQGHLSIVPRVRFPEVATDSLPVEQNNTPAVPGRSVR